MPHSFNTLSSDWTIAVLLTFFPFVAGTTVFIFTSNTSTLVANQAYYFKQEDKWRGRGKVEVKNMEKNQQLNTEELFWKPETKKIFTDKFVTIKTDSEILYGTGLDATENLSTYTITNPEGEIDVKE